jgi:uncharacterized membrane protein
VPLRIWLRLRATLWPIPMLAVACALAAGVLLPRLDRSLEGPEGHPLELAFGGGPSAARDLLAAIAGSLISVTGLVFSLTVIALQLASSQYSPRLLQTFATDRVVQGTLAWLSATFVYALTVLRTVRTEDATEGDTAFVPRLAITLGYLLALGSVLVLLLFLSHLARSLRVETQLRDVHSEAGPVLERELGDPQGGEGAGTTIRLPPGEPEAVCATASGFLTDVDEDAVVAAASAADAVVLLARRIGDPVVAGTPVAHVWGGGDEDVGAAVVGALALEYERSTTRDVAYSLRKVVDIAVRALSPGVNDPTTAVHALSHASAMLGDLVTRSLDPRCLRDDSGTLRLVVPQWDAEALLDVAVEEPVGFAGGQPAVLRRLAALLREIAWRAPRGLLDHRLRERMEQVCEVTRSSTSVGAEEVERWRADLEDALRGRWIPRVPPRLRTGA